MDSKEFHGTDRVLESLRRVGSPLALAALTTLIAGFTMTASQTLAYSQVGTFLVVISVFNLLYVLFLVVSSSTNQLTFSNDSHFQALFLVTVSRQTHVALRGDRVEMYDVVLQDDS